jgi:hypothetical protein
LLTVFPKYTSGIHEFAELVREQDMTSGDNVGRFLWREILFSIPGIFSVCHVMGMMMMKCNNWKY